MFDSGDRNESDFERRWLAQQVDFERRVRRSHRYLLIAAVVIGLGVGMAFGVLLALLG